MPFALGLVFILLAAPGCAYPTDSLPLREVDAGPFLVVRTVPEDGALGVEVWPEITVTFSRPVDPATVRADTIVITSGEVTVAAQRRVDSRTVVITPEEHLVAGVRYDVTITQGLASDLGASLDPTSFMFLTEEQADGGEG